MVLKDIETVYGCVVHSQMTDIYHFAVSKDKYYLQECIDDFKAIFEIEQDENYIENIKKAEAELLKLGVHVVNSEGPYNGLEITRINDLWILHDDEHAWPVILIDYYSWRF